MGEIDLSLREPDKLHSLSHGISHQQPHRIGIPDVFRGKDHHPAGDEFRIFPRFQHPGEPIERSMRIGITQAFNVGRNDIVMLFAGLVVP